MIRASEAFNKVLTLGVSSCLDVGSGGSHCFPFRTTTVDIKSPADIVGDFMKSDCGVHDLVWCSHALEHQPNPNLFIRKLASHCSGYLAITVPPLKNEIVGGHVTLWNAGILLYQMILAGLDCSEAMIKTYGYNISVIVKKKAIVLPELKYDFGDIETLSKYFPFDAKHGFDGRIEELNWKN